MTICFKQVLERLYFFIISLVYVGGSKMTRALHNLSVSKWRNRSNYWKGQRVLHCLQEAGCQGRKSICSWLLREDQQYEQSQNPHKTQKSIFLLKTVYSLSITSRKSKTEAFITFFFFAETTKSYIEEFQKEAYCCIAKGSSTSVTALFDLWHDNQPVLGSTPRNSVSSRRWGLNSEHWARYHRSDIGQL